MRELVEVKLNASQPLLKFLEKESIKPESSTEPYRSGDMVVTLTEDEKSIKIKSTLSDIWMIAKQFGRFCEREVN